MDIFYLYPRRLRLARHEIFFFSTYDTNIRVYGMCTVMQNVIQDAYRYNENIRKENADDKKSRCIKEKPHGIFFGNVSRFSFAKPVGGRKNS